MNKLPILLLAIITSRGSSVGHANRLVGNVLVVEWGEVDAPENDARDHVAGGAASLSRELQRENDLLSGAVPSRNDDDEEGDGDGGSGGGLFDSVAADLVEGAGVGVGRPADPPDEVDAAEDDHGGGGQAPSANDGASIAIPTEPAAEESSEEEAAPEGGDGDATTAQQRLLSVLIVPHIALSFYCAPDDGTSASVFDDGAGVPCSDVAYQAELELIESAAEEYVRTSELWMGAVSFDVMKEEGVEYEGVNLDLNLFSSRRLLGGRRLLGDVVERRSAARGARRNVRKRFTNVVLLTGEATFAVPSDLSPSDPAIPGGSHLSQLLLTILVTKEEDVVNKIRSRAESDDVGESSWMRTVVGCKAAYESDLVLHSENFRGDDVDAIAGANGTLDDAGGGMNLLLIIGAAGASFSLMLLVGGLCYAKRSYDADGGNDVSKKKRTGSSPSESDVVFQPGKNNPRSSNATSSIFKKLSTSGDALDGSAKRKKKPAALPPPMPLTDAGEATGGDDIDDDDESHRDFLLARAALGHSPIRGIGDEGSVADNTLDGDMSYAFTVEGDSLAPTTGGDRSSAGGSKLSEDAAIGAGGLASFANDKGVFRWNEDGTKMVYTPNVVAQGVQGDGGVGGEQNGFVFDESKKKWVMKDQVVGEKNVSFKANLTPQHAKIDGPPSVLRTRSNDSVGTGVTGLTEFSYGDVALDTRRSRSTGTERSHDTGTEGSLGVLGKSLSIKNKGSKVPVVVPPSPGTPRDQGVEMTAETAANIMVQPSKSFDSEFAPNTNVDKFMMGVGGSGDDDSTAFSDFAGSALTGLTGSAFGNSSDAPSAGGALVVDAPGRPLPPPLPPVVSPERASTLGTDAATLATSSTGGSAGAGDPGRIVPKRPASRPNKFKIAEDAPFDEDIPFDERPPAAAQSSSSGREKQHQKRSEAGLILPNMIDDIDDGSASEGSEETSNSEQVLEDLDKLSRFMMERKRSVKGQVGGSAASSRRRRKGGSNMGISGGGTSGRRVGAGRSAPEKGGSARYADPSRGL